MIQRNWDLDNTAGGNTKTIQLLWTSLAVSLNSKHEHTQ